jgi:hypothetical protein
MPYCTFCGKLCATAPGLERHNASTPECKKTSYEKFGQYSKSIWDDIPAKPNDSEEPEPRAIDSESDFNNDLLDHFHLEDDGVQIADETLNGEEINIPQQHPPPQHPPPQNDPHPHPQHATEEVNDGRRYIEDYPEEYLAGATWGHCRPLFESLDEERKREGGNRWTPFEDEDEWQLAEWLIRNVGQKQTDSFLKLPIVSFFHPLSVNIFKYHFTDSKTYATHLWE